MSATSAASELPLIEAFGASISQSIRSSTILIVGDAPLGNGLIVRILRRAGLGTSTRSKAQGRCGGAAPSSRTWC
jgi:hypothetical protein